MNNSPDDRRHWVFARSCSVFDANQVDSPEAPALPCPARLARAEPHRPLRDALCRAWRRHSARHGVNQACYVLTLGQIRTQLAGDPGRARRPCAAGRELGGQPRLRQPGDRGREVQLGRRHSARRRPAGHPHSGQGRSLRGSKGTRCARAPSRQARAGAGAFKLKEVSSRRTGVFAAWVRDAHLFKVHARQGFL